MQLKSLSGNPLDNNKYMKRDHRLLFIGQLPSFRVCLFAAARSISVALWPSVDEERMDQWLGVCTRRAGSNFTDQYLGESNYGW